jgi:hypothetical protein
VATLSIVVAIVAFLPEQKDLSKSVEMVTSSIATLLSAHPGLVAAGITACGVILAAGIAFWAAIFAARTTARMAGFAARMAANFSYSNKISEFRQAWINALRKDIADYISAAELWVQKWDELNFLESSEKEIRVRQEALPLSVSARTILNRVRLHFNPRADNPDIVEDNRFLKSLLDLLDPNKLDPNNLESSWRKLADSAVEQAREILKREWEKRLIALSQVRLNVVSSPG